MFIHASTRRATSTAGPAVRTPKTRVANATADVHAASADEPFTGMCFNCLGFVITAHTCMRVTFLHARHPQVRPSQGQVPPPDPVLQLPRARPPRQGMHRHTHMPQLPSARCVACSLLASSVNTLLAGHIAAECTVEAVCRKCGKPGHIAILCTSA